MSVFAGEVTLDRKDVCFVLLVPMLYILFVFIGYVAIDSWVGIKDYNQIIDLAKGLSYLSIAIVAAQTISKKEDNPVVKTINIIISAIFLGLAILLLVKSVNLAFSDVDGAENVIASWLYSVSNKLYWVAAVPLAIFFIMDSVQFCTGNENGKQRALAYLFFVDLLCFLPIAVVVFIGVMLSGRTGDFSEENTRLFVGGAMAFLCISHAIAGILTDRITNNWHD